MTAKVHVISQWTCWDCDETGTTFPGCEKHSEKAGHDVMWRGVPE